MPLPARVAAAWFAARRAAAGRGRGGWAPLVLRWRRLRRRPADRRAPHPAASIKPVWLPQFLLYFDQRAGERTRQEWWPALPPVAVVHQRFLAFRDRPGTTLRPAPPAPPHWRPLASSSPITVARAASPALLTRGAATARPSWVPRAAALAPGGARRQRRGISLERAVDSVRAGRPGQAQPQPAVARERPRRRVAQALPWRAITPGDSGPRQLVLEAAAPPPTRRPPELVWRSGRREPARDAVPEACTESSSPARGATGRSFPAPELSTGTARAQSAAAPRWPSLDPGFVDRLTEDVIRRVERHVRIERERRGL